MGGGKDKEIRVQGSQIGVFGNNVSVHGGIHFHYDGKKSAEPETANATDPAVAESPFGAPSAAHVLHLSDLHFGTVEDANRWHSQLAEDLKNELGCGQLDALILSGDIANRSEPDEYTAARVFLAKLSNEFGLSPDRIVIVPGNHDLNRILSKQGYQLIDRENVKGDLKPGCYIEVTEEVLRVRDEGEHQKRFSIFSQELYEKVKGEPYPTEYAEQAICHHLPSLNLLILGLNSAWETDHHFRSRVSICPDAVAHALSQIRADAVLQECLKFAVWHHPLVSPEEDRIKDHGFMEQLAKAGFSVCMHGHIHMARTDLYRYDLSPGGRQVHIVGAGTFGAPVREWAPGYPLQYNLLRISGNSLTVETRRREELNGAWKPDARWTQGPGKDPLPRYFIALPGWVQPKRLSEFGKSADAAADTQKIHDPEFEKEIRVYRQKAEALHEKLPLAGFSIRLKVPIDIEEIYVPLRAMMDLRATGNACFSDSEDAARCLRERGGDAEISIPDAFQKAKKMRPPRRGIVILGDPGSGKTTHLKRVLLWCLRGGLAELGLPKEILPVFLPLRNLTELDRGLDDFIQNQLGDPLLETAEGFGKRLLKRGNLLFLLDGLDEVAEPEHRTLVSRWIERALTLYPGCRFVVTCRFAGYTDEARLDEAFLEMHLRPMDTAQAEAFIRNWYRIVETGIATDPAQGELKAKAAAEDLIERLRQPEFRSRRVFELTRNPLLLTNICLVHHSRGNLPHTRALLYEECIDVLLERWHGAINLPGRVTGQVGRRVLQPTALWLHQEERRTRATAGELAPVIEPVVKSVGWPYGSAADFLKAVRDDSGLLTGWSGDQYGFMHLGFQEYLAAREIQRVFIAGYGKSDVLKQLADKFGQGWWQEVTLLLVALADHCLFEPFMREVVQHPAFAEHSGLVEMCLDDAAERSTGPFLELLEQDATKNPDRLWERQLLALRTIEKIDKDALESVMARLAAHPDDNLRQWIRERRKEAVQKSIRPEPSGYELVWIPGGAFMMGSDEYDDERPIHEVHVPDFYMGRYPVTNEEYGRFLAATGYKEPDYWADRNFNQPRQPVVGVSWHDAKKYAEWAGLSLPSEAQWEYACRAGTTTRYYTGDSKEDLDRAGWYHDNSENQLHPVGEKEPNAFGLYDMHGNVWEWCEDDWHGSYKNTLNNGRAWVDDPRGSARVLRGGSWGGGAGSCRAAGRFRRDPDDRSNGYGFRLVCLPGQRGEPSR